MAPSYNNDIAGDGDSDGRCQRIIQDTVVWRWRCLGHSSQLYETQKAVASHNFLHLTFQEFLAAVHISNMEAEQRLQHYKRHKEGRLRVVLRFLAGIIN